MLNLSAAIFTLKIIIIALLKNWIQILFTGIFLYLNFNFIEMIWLKWFLTVIVASAFFYSVYHDINLFIQQRALQRRGKPDSEANG